MNNVLAEAFASFVSCLIFLDMVEEYYGGLNAIELLQLGKGFLRVAIITKICAFISLIIVILVGIDILI